MEVIMYYRRRSRPRLPSARLTWTDCGGGQAGKQAGGRGCGLALAPVCRDVRPVARKGLVLPAAAGRDACRSRGDNMYGNSERRL